MFLNISQILQKNICVGVSFLIKLQSQACNFIKKILQRRYFPVKLAMILTESNSQEETPSHEEITKLSLTSIRNVKKHESLEKMEEISNTNEKTSGIFWIQKNK